MAVRAKIRIQVDAAFPWSDIPLAALEWYRADVGLFRLERWEPSPTKFVVDGTVTLELTSR